MAGKAGPRGTARGLYDKRRANRISFRVVAAVAVLFAAYIGAILSFDPARAGERELVVRSLFGFRVAYSDISELRLEKEPISTGIRVFGDSAFGFFREGDYMVDGLGKARVFLKRPNASYVIVRTADRDYAVSLGSLEKDQLLYDAIKLGMARGK